MIQIKPIDNKKAREIFKKLKEGIEAMPEGSTVSIADLLQEAGPEGEALVNYVNLMSEFTAARLPGQCRHSIMESIMQVGHQTLTTRFLLDEVEIEGSGHAVTLGILVGYMAVARYIGMTMEVFDAFDRAGPKGSVQH